MKESSILIVITFFSISVAAQKVAATVDKQKILIGEQFHLKLQANFKQEEAFSFFNLDTIANFEILNKSAIDTSKFNGGVALIQTLTLTSWDSGKTQILPFSLGKFKTPSLTIDVAYSPSPFDTTQPYHDVHNILEVKRPAPTTWYWYLIGALILILLFILFFPKGKPRSKEKFVSDEGAYKKALRKLNALQKNSSADNKIFYTELVQIFREYLHKRKNIYSFSKTTGDLSIQIEKLELNREDYQQLMQTLRLSDMVKYAKYQPTSAENENSVETIRKSIIIIEQLPTRNFQFPNPH